MTNAERNALRVHACAAAAALDAAYYAREAIFRRLSGDLALADRAEDHVRRLLHIAEWHSNWADATERRVGVSVFPGTPHARPAVMTPFPVERPSNCNPHIPQDNDPRYCRLCNQEVAPEFGLSYFTAPTKK